MSSLNTVTGRNGEFVHGSTRLLRITQWSLTTSLATKSEWGDSDGEGFTNRAAGRRDGTFTCEGKYDTSTEVFDVFREGDIGIAVLWMNGTLYWDFPRALCDDFGMVVNVDTEEVIGWTAGFGADGRYYYPGENGATARTLPS